MQEETINVNGAHRQISAHDLINNGNRKKLNQKGTSLIMTVALVSLETSMSLPEECSIQKSASFLYFTGVGTLGRVVILEMMIGIVYGRGCGDGDF